MTGLNEVLALEHFNIYFFLHDIVHSNMSKLLKKDIYVTTT